MRYRMDCFTFSYRSWIITMNPLSIIILVAIMIFCVWVIIYLLTHKKNGCGFCNGDCKNCQKHYEKILDHHVQKKEDEQDELS